MLTKKALEAMRMIKLIDADYEDAEVGIVTCCHPQHCRVIVKNPEAAKHTGLSPAIYKSCTLAIEVKTGDIVLLTGEEPEVVDCIYSIPELKPEEMKVMPVDMPFSQGFSGMATLHRSNFHRAREENTESRSRGVIRNALDFSSLKEKFDPRLSQEFQEHLCFLSRGGLVTVKGTTGLARTSYKKEKVPTAWPLV
eukprot:TRINITY_DN2392_c0_g1_i1.p1 TRINITY_DN2392_c0_g1~~TRINITY_DN2392_c0_g1_i1.p1  ORF type:complete len:195 (+),score=27.39 TRINITY_DN2392_c0_g1_i1:47-631(+)